MKYYPRLIEKLISRMLKSSGAISVQGPKFSGKTTTCKKFAKSSIELTDWFLVSTVKADPYLALKGSAPHLIDEWQTIPQLWDLVRVEVDKKPGFGKFILTGSAIPADNSLIFHSGAGRITPLTMRTMSLYESKDSLGYISLKELFDNKDYKYFYENKESSLTDIVYYICRGGWPMSMQKDRNTSIDVTKNYYLSLFNFKNSENPKYKNKNPEILKNVLRSYARNVSTEATYQTLLTDVQKSENRNMDIKTFDTYLDIARELFIVEDMEAWCPNLRSNTAIRTTPTRHFVDPSIAAMALGISPNDLLFDVRTLGLFFEDLAIRDLRIYTDCLGGRVRHYRDKNDLECDAVIHLDDGRWAPIEIKLGSTESIEMAAKKIKKLIDKLDESYPKPAFMGIVVANGIAYKRPDGIYVIPLNLLKD